MPTIELPALIIDGFTTEPSAGARLVLVNRDPAPGENDAPLDGIIALELIDTGADGIDRAQTRVWVDGLPAFESGAATPRFAGPRAAVLHTADTLRIVLDPLEAFQTLATVTVRVAAQTNGGSSQIDTQYSFFTADRVGPRVVSVQAMASKVVRVAFDEPVALGPLTACVLTARSAPAVPIRVTRASVDRSIVVLELNTEMTPDAQYELRVAGITDTSENPVKAPFDTAFFAGFHPPRPPNRRFDLWSLVPAHNRREDQTGDLFRWISCLQEVTDLLLATADRWSDIFDIERAAEGFVDLILADLGNPFPFELDLPGKRRLASVLIAMYRQVGTTKGIQNAVRFFLGIEISAIVAFNVDTLYLGDAELGVDWVLGPSDRRALYSFDLLVSRQLSQVERRQLRAIAEFMKPAHTHFVHLVEPSPPPPALDHWELGFSEMNSNTILAAG